VSLRILCCPTIKFERVHSVMSVGLKGAGSRVRRIVRVRSGLRQSFSIHAIAEHTELRSASRRGRSAAIVDIRFAGAHQPGRWEVPTKGLPKDFALAFQDLYVLCASNAKVRHDTAEWIALMRETTG
jgi:hypothetical protein